MLKAFVVRNISEKRGVGMKAFSSFYRSIKTSGIFELRNYELDSVLDGSVWFKPFAYWRMASPHHNF